MQRAYGQRRTERPRTQSETQSKTPSRQSEAETRPFTAIEPAIRTSSHAIPELCPVQLARAQYYCHQPIGAHRIPSHQNLSQVFSASLSPSSPVSRLSLLLSLSTFVCFASLLTRLTTIKKSASLFLFLFFQSSHLILISLYSTPLRHS